VILRRVESVRSAGKARVGLSTVALVAPSMLENGLSRPHKARSRAVLLDAMTAAFPLSSASSISKDSTFQQAARLTCRRHCSAACDVGRMFGTAYRGSVVLGHDAWAFAFASVCLE
jgi:hypothetical protein